MPASKPRIALVLDEHHETRQWLSSSFDTVEVQRGRHLAADLAAASADLIILETVHPSEAGWLLSWVRAQPRLAPKPVLLLLPFGPAPRARGRAGVAFLEKPLDRPSLVAQVERLLAPQK
jgi:hypothetical protein